ncbi:MAG: ATP-binding protein [Planctomycetes bacterium]|nr:ATP-binding protein [Planctomycetota bacterium]
MEFVAEAPCIAERHIEGWTIDPDPADKNRVIDSIIQHLSAAYRLGPSVLFKYRLCLDEAITNAICHGCRGVENAKVTVDFYHSGDRWALRVVDPGKGFDPNEIPDPSEPGSEFKESGRGILILQRYTDKLVYSKSGTEQIFWMDTTELQG